MNACIGASHKRPDPARMSHTPLISGHASRACHAGAGGRYPQDAVPFPSCGSYERTAHANLCKRLRWWWCCYCLSQLLHAAWAHIGWLVHGRVPAGVLDGSCRQLTRGRHCDDRYCDKFISAVGSHASKDLSLLAVAGGMLLVQHKKPRTLPCFQGFAVQTSPNQAPNIMLSCNRNPYMYIQAQAHADSHVHGATNGNKKQRSDQLERCCSVHRRSYRRTRMPGTLHSSSPSALPLMTPLPAKSTSMPSLSRTGCP